MIQRRFCSKIAIMEGTPAEEYISQEDDSGLELPIMEGSPAEEYVSQEDESDFDSEEFEDETSARMREVEEALPVNMALLEVVGADSTPCSDCGKSSWGYGEYYVYDAQQPRGSDKFCLDCAHMKYCQIDEDEDELAEEEEDAAIEIEDELVEKGYIMVADVDLLDCTSARPSCSVCKSKWERFWFCNARDFAKVNPEPGERQP